MIRFHLYGLLIGLGIVASSELSRAYAKKHSLVLEKENSLLLLVIGFGLVGARLYHVVDYWGRYYSKSIIEVFFVWNGGLGIWGAIVGGLIGLIIYKRLIKPTNLDFLRLLDLISYGLPIGQTIGRLGNFFNQEIYGLPTKLPWGIYIAETGKFHQPLFAYEALANLFLFGLINLVIRKKYKPGLIVGTYLVGYGLIRFGLELLRTNNWLILGIPTSIYFSIVVVVIGARLIWRR